MRIPTATYRIQFNSQFTFHNANDIVAYLADLGISDLYASPIFKARAGSTHGYDVVNPNQLNPELGTDDDFNTLVQSLQGHQMGWLQDIVPNHMAYDTANEYLMDVLEFGADSDYVDYFDIAWNAPFGDRTETILAPLLGNFYGECLENGEIQLKYDESGLSVNYYALSIPLRLESYATFLTQNLGKLAHTLGRKHPDFIKLLGILYMVKSIPNDVKGKQREDQTDFIKGLLWELYTNNEDINSFVKDNITLFNGESGNTESFNLLDKLLSEQFFRLSYWKVGAEEMNYRRFFTVNELISVRVEELKVFNSTHALIYKMVQEGKFTGLRVDHIDGLFDPTEYLKRLRDKMGDTYITVEKILQPKEDLPSNWPIQGTSGYDYLNLVNGVFCQSVNEEPLDRLYQDFTGIRPTFEQMMLEKKQFILDHNLSGDLDNLAAMLRKIASKHRYSNDFTVNGLKRAIAEVLIRFPVYRTYTDPHGLMEGDREYIQSVIQAAKDHNPLLQNEFNFLEKLLLLEYEPNLTQAEKDQWLYFVMRLQQYTGPLMAKGVEDTALYVFNRLTSLNEVGGSPERFGCSLEEFHQFNEARQQQWPSAMSATSTHDTKRGEDTRARINVLSEIPDEWREQVYTWSEINRHHKQRQQRLTMPHPNDEYLFYQTLVGAYPFETESLDNFRDRMKDYAIKAIREAKMFTRWLHSNEAYENACLSFIDAILDRSSDNPFLKAFLPFQQRIASYGIFNSLSQVLLKMASPGIPDIYQGTELWDFSLVDPDNRLPVNFGMRQQYLDSLQQGIQNDIVSLMNELLANKTNSRIKLFITTQLLKARSKHQDVFQQGKYMPLRSTGAFSNHLITFARSTPDATLIAVAPRFLTRLIQPGQNPLGHEVWQDTAIQLPSSPCSSWTNLITQQSIDGTTELAVGDILKHFPIALLQSN